ncbi:hypothetical protein Tco_0903006, partial [Tanacetum coccineum]
ASGGSDRDVEDTLSKLAKRPTTLGEAFSLAHIIEDRFEIKGSLDADEDIGVDEVSSAIDDVFGIGESNVENMEVRSKFDEFSKNKKSVEEVVVGGGKFSKNKNRVISVLKDGGGEFDDTLNEINLGLSEEFVIRVLEGRDVSGESYVVFMK